MGTRKARATTPAAERWQPWRREAAAALALEPENWVIHEQMAQLYAIASTTDPRYAERAQYHVARVRALAPNRLPLDTAGGRQTGFRSSVPASVR